MISTSKINALVGTDPNDTVIALRLFEMVYCALNAVTYCIIKLLVGIFRSARPYLKFRAVYVVSACYVQAFASKCLYSAPCIPACEEPLLSGGINAGLYSNRRSVGVGRSCQAFGCIHLSSLESHGWLLDEEYVPPLRPGSRRRLPMKLDTFSTRDTPTRKEHIRRYLRPNGEGQENEGY